MAEESNRHLPELPNDCPPLRAGLLQLADFGVILKVHGIRPQEIRRMSNIQETDPQIADLIRQEEKRQATTLELIASENHVSKAVMEAAGSVLTNKYAEGYPGARYYGGCGFYDEIENLAIDRAKQLFGCKYANVQPHSD